MATTTYVLKNAKGEVVSTVRAQNATDAQYISGVTPEYVKTTAPVAAVEKEVINFDVNGHRK